MKHTLSTSEIIDLLLADEYAKWSLSAAQTLAEYYEELELDSGQELELDRVLIRTEWSEYDSLADIRSAYKNSCNEDYTDQEFLEWLADETTFFELENKHYLIYAF